MKLALFDTHPFEKEVFDKANRQFGFDITYYDTRLNYSTAKLAKGFDGVCCFVNDQLDSETVCELGCQKISFIALRCAGFNNVDLREAERHEIAVFRVPAYSPHAIAEHAMALILCLNRKIHHAYLRIKEQNFSLNGLVGFDLYNKTVGVVGTGRIGKAFCRIAKGFGCKILAYDLEPSEEFKFDQIVKYCTLDELLRLSDIVSLHLPLTPETYHLIDTAALSKVKSDAYLINTGRGALIDSRALINALKQSEIGGAGLDVYEEEEGVFFEDLSSSVIQDDVLARLMTFPNVLITSHQGFLTQQALENIAQTTLSNIVEFKSERKCQNIVLADEVIRPIDKKCLKHD